MKRCPLVYFALGPDPFAMSVDDPLDNRQIYACALILIITMETLASVLLCESGLVTTTSTKPNAWAGIIAVILMPFITGTLVAGTPPNVTEDLGANRLPLIVMPVPLAGGPIAGSIPVMAGGRSCWGCLEDDNLTALNSRGK